jgi:hypothetical protein
VTANQAPPGDVTKTIGAKQGSGRDTVASIFESPLSLAGNVPVETFVVVAALPSIVWQLTMARRPISPRLPRLLQ